MTEPRRGADDSTQLATLVDRPSGRAAVTLDLVPGARIRQYELVREIGRGGMGRVFLARDTRLGRQVAMKFIATAERELARRFVKEARATARCTHENIVVIHEVDEHDGTPYMVLEYLEGETLGARLRRSARMAPAEAVEMMVPTLRALERAHALGIVHRDLKVENIFVTRGGQVKVLDFGVAKMLEEDDDRHTAAGAAIGTPANMAPEQLRLDPIDGRTDLWACGVILFRMLAGRHPLGDRAAEADAVEAIMDLAVPMPGLASAAPDLPPELCRIVDTCLAKDRTERWPSARALLDALTGTVASPPPPVRSVAVLPFHNAGPEEDAYLADGLTDDLIDALSMTRGLRVRPRSATRPYTGDVDHRTAGAELDVQVIVEGSVRRRGADGLRITARIVSVTDCFQEWSKRFDRPAGDALVVSDEVAAALSQALTIPRTAAPREAVTDPVVIDLYLRGRAALRGIDAPSAERALDLLEQARGRAPYDPTILAAAARASARALFFRYDTARADRALDLARQALAAAPGSGEVELALAQVCLSRGEFASAAAHAARASRRAPFLAEAHALIGRMRVEVGPVHDGIAALDRALALDPALRAARYDRARSYALLGDDEAAASLLADRDAIDVQPKATLAARLAMWRSDPARWLPSLPALDESHAAAQRELFGVLLASMRERAVSPESATMLRAVVSSVASPRFRPLLLQISSELYAYCGEDSASLDHIALALQAGLIDLVWLDLCPVLDRVRTTPRFAELRAALESHARPIRDALAREEDA